MIDSVRNVYSDLLLSAARKLNQPDSGREQRDLVRLIIRLHTRLTRPLRCVLLGEVNSGKSTLANLLIGETVVPTSVVANSRFPIRFHYAEKTSLAAHTRDGGRVALDWSQIETLSGHPVDRIDIGLPVERLKVFEIIDMPGTGNPDHDVSGFERQRTLAHVPIWCTVASRAWKESERKEWSRLPSAQKTRALLVVTQVDLLPDRTDLTKVLARLDGEAAQDFRTIVPLATPDAVRSSVITSESDESDLWEQSGGARLEQELERLFSDLNDQRVMLAQRALHVAFVRRGLLADGASRQCAVSLTELISRHVAQPTNDLTPIASLVEQPGQGGVKIREAAWGDGSAGDLRQ